MHQKRSCVLLKKIWNHEPRKKMSKKYKVTGWAIVATIERPDGTWFDNTITDVDKETASTVDAFLNDYKTTEEENFSFS